MKPPRPNACFVYGTLMRGGANHGVWPAAPTRVASATILAALHDLGPYPGMVAGGDRVAGECWWFADRDLAEVWRVIDALEDHRGRHDDAYRRELVACRLANGRELRVWAYRYLGATGPATRIAPDAGGLVRWRDPRDRDALPRRPVRLGLGPA